MTTIFDDLGSRGYIAAGASNFPQTGLMSVSTSKEMLAFDVVEVFDVFATHNMEITSCKISESVSGGMKADITAKKV